MFFAPSTPIEFSLKLFIEKTHRREQAVIRINQQSRGMLMSSAVRD